MSRIGKKPIPIPSGAEVKIADGTVTVKGPKGTLTFKPHGRVRVKIEEKNVIIERSGDEILDRSLHGLTRSLIANMIQGVSEGYCKKLEIQGVGYRAQIQDKKLILSLGYSHPIDFPAPEGITFEIDKEKKNIISICGIDKEKVGRVAAKIRSFKKPEPYKGKGIRYIDEIVRRKAGKAAATAAKGVGPQ